MNTYVIRVTTIDNLYADYMIEADNFFIAKIKARNSFFRDYPGANKNLKLSLDNPTSKQLTEILKILEEDEKNG